jgi:hypothetical protein
MGKRIRGVAPPPGPLPIRDGEGEYEGEMVA